MPSFLDALRDPAFRAEYAQGLMDALNRGGVASTVGGPVDMALTLANLGIAGGGYLGHKLGLMDQPPELIDPKKAVGSSEWLGEKMRQKGMVSEARNPVAEFLASMVVPVGMAKAGQAAFRGEEAAYRAAQNAEKALEKAVPAIMERGGLTAEALGAFGTGTKSNVYLPNTPLKPDPLVGTRYETERLPGKIAARQPINWEDLRGGSLMTYPTDMLSRHTRIKNVSGIDLNRPVDTVGGLEYMMDLENIAKDVAYASNKGATTAQHNRVLRAIDENKALGGTGRVFVAPHTMAYGGENFSTTPSEGLLSLIETVNPKKKVRDQISDMIREATVKGVKGKFKDDFVGLSDKSLRDQLMTGAGLESGSAGELRKVFTEKMASKKSQIGLGFNYEDLQQAMLNPIVKDKPTYWMGDSIYEAYPHLAPQRGEHPAYTHDLMGKFVGNTEGGKVQDVMGPLFQQLLQGEIGKPGDPLRHTTGKLSTAGHGISLFLDDAQISRLKRLLGE